jgi:hypothetical protein
VGQHAGLAADRADMGAAVTPREQLRARIHEILGTACPDAVVDDLEAAAVAYAASHAGTHPPCCDLHGRNCEPPGDLCCENCTEARHVGWEDSKGVMRYVHPAGETCSNPDLSPNSLAEAAKIDAAVAAERERIRHLAARHDAVIDMGPLAEPRYVSFASLLAGPQ